MWRRTHEETHRLACSSVRPRTVTISHGFHTGFRVPAGTKHTHTQTHTHTNTQTHTHTHTRSIRRNQAWQERDFFLSHVGAVVKRRGAGCGSVARSSRTADFLKPQGSLVNTHSPFDAGKHAKSHCTSRLLAVVLLLVCKGMNGDDDYIHIYIYIYIYT